MIIYIDEYGHLANSGYKVELTGGYYYSKLHDMFVYEVKKSEIPILKILTNEKIECK